MRKNCARKWLHLVIDLLPILIIPIFAIWEINHKENESITVEVEKHEVVNFNQLLDIDTAEYTVDTNSFNRFARLDVKRNFNHIYVFKGYAFGDYSTFHVNVVNYSVTNYPQLNYDYVDGYFELRFSASYGINVLDLFAFGVSANTTVTGGDFQLFDLTQMYGVGNEPSLVDFNNDFSLPYYEYTLSRKELITNGTIVYDNTDIGSQMLYAIYKPVQQYFNFDNIFNFGALRNWFELNFFNGNMGIPMTIIWNIIIYEFLSDVIMLIYAFFMFIIDFANDLLEKPFSDIKRG